MLPVNSPLAGVTVIAIEQAVAAPFCSARLADAGARVIKIERPEGDFARGYDDVAAGQSSYFVWLNRGKESLVLDLTASEDQRALHDLLPHTDVLIQNLKPGVLTRLGFDPSTLRRRYPQLIVCSISGYGDTGPYSNRKAYDLLIQAESGLSSITGGPSEPARVGISIVDIATGATAYSAILEALIARTGSGRGSAIHVSMFDVMADWLTVPLLHQEGGKPPRRQGLSHPSIAPYGVFKTKDGRDILISIQSDREWVKFSTEFLGDSAAAQDERFISNVARVRNRVATDALVAAAFLELDGAAAIARLTAADIAYASVNDMAALAAHPHLRRITVDTPSGPISMPAPGATFEGPPRSYGPVPALNTSDERRHRT